MEKFKVVFKRQMSPIAYFSAVARPDDNPFCEKIGFNLGGTIVPVPIVKGSHVRGKFRRWLAKEIIMRNEESIRGLPDFKERMSILTAMFFSGSLTAGFKLKDENTFNAQVELFEKDPFGKYLGYMLTGLDNKRSRFLLGFLTPAIKDFNDDENTVAVNPEFEVKKEQAGNKWMTITDPLTAILSSRKAPIIGEVAEILLEEESEEVIEETKRLLSAQSSSEKIDVQNLLYFEVINTGFDMVQEVLISSDKEKELVGILTAYHKYFNEIDRTIGGLGARGFGLLDGVVIEGFTPNEKAFDEFVESINLKEITDIVIYDSEKIKEAEEKAAEKRKKKKEKEEAKKK